MPSPAVVRSIIAQHEPRLLETMDALKEKFGAKLVALTVPKAGLTLGDQSRYSAEAIERNYSPWIPNTDTVGEAKEWARLKAKGREDQARKPARAGPRRRAA